MVMGRFRLISLLLVVALGATRPAFAQQPPVTSSQPQQTAPRPSLPLPDESANLDRIREGLKRPEILKVRQEGTRFYLTVVGERIDIHEYLANSDLKYAPVPGAGVTHQDFLNHITPKYLYSSGGIKATELLEWNLVNWLGQMAVKKIIGELSEAAKEAQIRRIREQIDRELAALKGGK